MNIGDQALRAAKVDNPFDHTTPDVTFFGIEFANTGYAILGGIWGIAFLFAAGILVISIVKFMAAKKVQHNPDAVSDAASSMKLAGIGTVALAGVGIIFGALIGLF